MAPIQNFNFNFNDTINDLGRYLFLKEELIW